MQSTCAFLEAATQQGYRLIIVSGRDRSILPAVQDAIEELSGLKPFLYCFKPVDSRQPTHEFKAATIKQLVGCCVSAGITVTKVICIDDMESHMSSMRFACSDAGVGSVGVSACRGLSNVDLRMHSLTPKHIVVLALPHGSRKLRILQVTHTHRVR